MSALLRSTIGNKAWVRQNAAGLKKLLPETWTHMQNLNMLGIGYNLKLLGVDWRSNEELSKIMVILERIKVLQRDGIQVRANPHFDGLAL